MLPTLALLLPLLVLAPSTPDDGTLARQVRRALQDDGSGRLVSRESLVARARGRSDLTLARDASDAINEALGQDVRGLLVSASDGVIDLRGEVAPDAAEQALRVAAAVPGAVGVRSSLAGEPVALDLADPSDPFSFATDRLLGGEAIRVQVQDGLVHVSGTVNGAAARRQVLAAVRSVRGVRAVVDDLTEHDPGIGNDLGLLGILRHKLSNLPELRVLVEKLDITVRAGVVRVSGEVDSDLQRKLVEVTLLATHGVLVVVSDLEPGGGAAAPPAPPLT